MPRQARRKSSTGIYHVMLRGVDKRAIFLDEQDNKKFIQHLKKSKVDGGFELYAYCLMTNHVHLLIKEHEEIGDSIKRIAVRYAAWHRKKYDRTGHLFQNRYLSEPVESDSYLMTVLRYIIQNPVKAGIVGKPEEYLWSCFNQYVKAYRGEKTIVDPGVITDLFNTFDDFYRHVSSSNDDKCIDYDSRMKYNDDTLKDIIMKKHDIKNLHKLSVKERGKVINTILLETDASVRQLSRVLEIDRSSVMRATKQHR
ncbi:MAG: transposase [Clostridiales bacterium]|nr:transposase [Clostridiales bacterium]